MICYCIMRPKKKLSNLIHFMSIPQNDDWHATLSVVLCVQKKIIKLYRFYSTQSQHACFLQNKGCHATCLSVFYRIMIVTRHVCLQNNDSHATCLLYNYATEVFKFFSYFSFFIY